MDAYNKLRHTIEEVNALILKYSGNNEDLTVRRSPFYHLGVLLVFFSG